MKVKFEDSGPCRKLLSIEVPRDDVVPDYEKVLAMYARNANVPGFRHGKAPQAVVERHYAKHIADDARDHLIPRFYHEALEKEKIQPVAVLDVRDVVFDKTTGLSFKVMLDVAPEFKMPKYRKLTVKAEPVEVTDKDVQEVVDHLLTRAARYEDISGRGAQENDMVQLDYHGTLDGQPVSELVPGCQGLGAATDFWVLLGEPEFLPGFNTALSGMHEGEERDVTVNFSEDYHVKDVAGKTAQYHVKLKAMRERHLPEMNDEFAVSMGAESAEALLTNIRTDLQQMRENAEKNRREEVIIKQLLEKVDFELPESIVQEEVQQVLRGMIHNMASRGQTREQLVEQRDALWKEADVSARDRVRLMYILNKIAKEEKLDVGDKEIDDAIGALAARQRMDVAEMREQLEKNNRMETLHTDLLNRKAMELVMENAKIK